MRDIFCIFIDGHNRASTEVYLLASFAWLVVNKRRRDVGKGFLISDREVVQPPDYVLVTRTLPILVNSPWCKSGFVSKNI
jgi:hypothetical protein